MQVNWLEVFFHLPWLSGLGLILLALSLYNYRATQNQQPWRTQFAAPTFQLAWAIGLTLINLSLLLLSEQWWERLIWAAFLLLFGWQSWQAHQTRATKP